MKQLQSSTEDLGGMSILVVDDDADSREFIAFVLAQAGASVTPVASGAEALQAFSQSAPDLIASDIGMPEMDGYILYKNSQFVVRTREAGSCDRPDCLCWGDRSAASHRCRFSTPPRQTS